MSWAGLYDFLNYLDISWGKNHVRSSLEAAGTALLFSNFQFS